MKKRSVNIKKALFLLFVLLFSLVSLAVYFYVVEKAEVVEPEEIKLIEPPALEKPAILEEAPIEIPSKALSVEEAPSVEELSIEEAPEEKAPEPRRRPRGQIYVPSPTPFVQVSQPVSEEAPAETAVEASSTLQLSAEAPAGEIVAPAVEAPLSAPVLKLPEVEKQWTGLSCSDDVVETDENFPDGIEIPVRKLIVARHDSGERIIDTASSRCNPDRTAYMQRKCAKQYVDVESSVLEASSLPLALQDAGLLSEGVVESCSELSCEYDENSVAYCKGLDVKPSRKLSVLVDSQPVSFVSFSDKITINILDDLALEKEFVDYLIKTDKKTVPRKAVKKDNIFTDTFRLIKEILAPVVEEIAVEKPPEELPAVVEKAPAKAVSEDKEITEVSFDEVTAVLIDASESIEKSIEYDLKIGDEIIKRTALREGDFFVDRFILQREEKEILSEVLSDGKALLFEEAFVAEELEDAVSEVQEDIVEQSGLVEPAENEFSAVATGALITSLQIADGGDEFFENEESLTFESSEPVDQLPEAPVEEAVSEVPAEDIVSEVPLPAEVQVEAPVAELPEVRSPDIISVPSDVQNIQVMYREQTLLDLPIKNAVPPGEEPCFDPLRGSCNNAWLGMSCQRSGEAGSCNGVGVHYDYSLNKNVHYCTCQVAPAEEKPVEVKICSDDNFISDNECFDKSVGSLCSKTLGVRRHCTSTAEEDWDGKPGCRCEVPEHVGFTSGGEYSIKCDISEEGEIEVELIPADDAEERLDELSDKEFDDVVCGDGFKDFGETCDGDIGCEENYVCSDDCKKCKQIPVCGDLHKTEGEECDVDVAQRISADDFCPQEKRCNLATCKCVAESQPISATGSVTVQTPNKPAAYTKESVPAITGKISAGIFEEFGRSEITLFESAPPSVCEENKLVKFRCIEGSLTAEQAEEILSAPEEERKNLVLSKSEIYCDECSTSTECKVPDVLEGEKETVTLMCGADINENIVINAVVSKKYFDESERVVFEDYAELPAFCDENGNKVTTSCTGQSLAVSAEVYDAKEIPEGLFEKHSEECPADTFCFKGNCVQGSIDYEIVSKVETPGKEAVLRIVPADKGSGDVSVRFRRELLPEDSEFNLDITKTAERIESGVYELRFEIPEEMYAPVEIEVSTSTSAAKIPDLHLLLRSSSEEEVETVEYSCSDLIPETVKFNKIPEVQSETEGFVKSPAYARVLVHEGSYDDVKSGDSYGMIYDGLSSEDKTGFLMQCKQGKMYLPAYLAGSVKKTSSLGWANQFLKPREEICVLWDSSPTIRENPGILGDKYGYTFGSKLMKGSLSVPQLLRYDELPRCLKYSDKIQACSPSQEEGALESSLFTRRTNDYVDQEYDFGFPLARGVGVLNIVYGFNIAGVNFLNPKNNKIQPVEYKTILYYDDHLASCDGTGFTAKICNEKMEIDFYDVLNDDFLTQIKDTAFTEKGYSCPIGIGASFDEDSYLVTTFDSPTHCYDKLLKLGYGLKCSPDYYPIEPFVVGSTGNYPPGITNYFSAPSIRISSVISLQGAIEKLAQKPSEEAPVELAEPVDLVEEVVERRELLSEAEYRLLVEQGYPGDAGARLLLERANQLFENGNFDGASLDYVLMLEKDYEDQFKVQAYYRLGIIALNNGVLKEAIKYFSSALELEPDNADIKNALLKVENIVLSSVGRALQVNIQDIYNAFTSPNPYRLYWEKTKQVVFDTIEYYYETEYKAQTLSEIQMGIMVLSFMNTDGVALKEADELLRKAERVSIVRKHSAHMLERLPSEQAAELAINLWLAASKALKLGDVRLAVQGGVQTPEQAKEYSDLLTAGKVNWWWYESEAPPLIEQEISIVPSNFNFITGEGYASPVEFKSELVNAQNVLMFSLPFTRVGGAVMGTRVGQFVFGRVLGATEASNVLSAVLGIEKLSTLFAATSTGVRFASLGGGYKWALETGGEIMLSVIGFYIDPDTGMILSMIPLSSGINRLTDLLTSFQPKVAERIALRTRGILSQADNTVFKAQLKETVKTVSSDAELADAVEMLLKQKGVSASKAKLVKTGVKDDVVAARQDALEESVETLKSQKEEILALAKKAEAPESGLATRKFEVRFEDGTTRALDVTLDERVQKAFELTKKFHSESRFVKEYEELTGGFFDMRIAGGNARNALLGKAPTSRLSDVDIVIPETPAGMSTELLIEYRKYQEGLIEIFKDTAAFDVKRVKPGETFVSGLEGSTGGVSDFTINAVEVSYDGTVHAAKQTIDDLLSGIGEKTVLRTLRAKEDIEIDVIFRGIRFASEYDAVFDEATMKIFSEIFAELEPKYLELFLRQNNVLKAFMKIFVKGKGDIAVEELSRFTLKDGSSLVSGLKASGVDLDALARKDLVNGLKNIKRYEGNEEELINDLMTLGMPIPRKPIYYNRLDLTEVYKNADSAKKAKILDIEHELEDIFKELKIALREGDEDAVKVLLEDVEEYNRKFLDETGFVFRDAQKSPNAFDIDPRYYDPVHAPPVLQLIVDKFEVSQKLLKDRNLAGVPETYLKSIEGGVPKAYVQKEIATSFEEAGSGAAVFIGEVEGYAGKLALKVDRGPRGVITTWDDAISGMRKEVEKAKVFEQLGIGPKVIGEVDVGGNPTFAMEYIEGTFPEVLLSRFRNNELSAQEMKQLISENTLQQVYQKSKQLLDAGWWQGDYQFLVLTKDQFINGVRHSKGDIVFIDAGSLTRGTYNSETAKFIAIDREFSAARAIDSAVESLDNIMQEVNLKSQSLSLVTGQATLFLNLHKLDYFELIDYFSGYFKNFITVVFSITGFAVSESPQLEVSMEEIVPEKIIEGSQSDVIEKIAVSSEEFPSEVIVEQPIVSGAEEILTELPAEIPVEEALFVEEVSEEMPFELPAEIDVEEEAAPPEVLSEEEVIEQFAVEEIDFSPETTKLIFIYEDVSVEVHVLVPPVEVAPPEAGPPVEKPTPSFEVPVGPPAVLPVGPPVVVPAEAPPVVPPSAVPSVEIPAEEFVALSDVIPSEAIQPVEELPAEISMEKIAVEVPLPEAPVVEEVPHVAVASPEELPSVEEPVVSPVSLEVFVERKPVSVVSFLDEINVNIGDVLEKVESIEYVIEADGKIIPRTAVKKEDYFVDEFILEVEEPAPSFEVPVGPPAVLPVGPPVVVPAEAPPVVPPSIVPSVEIPAEEFVALPIEIPADKVGVYFTVDESNTIISNFVYKESKLTIPTEYKTELNACIDDKSVSVKTRSKQSVENIKKVYALEEVPEFIRNKLIHVQVPVADMADSSEGMPFSSTELSGPIAVEEVSVELPAEVSVEEVSPEVSLPEVVPVVTPSEDVVPFIEEVSPVAVAPPEELPVEEIVVPILEEIVQPSEEMPSELPAEVVEEVVEPTVLQVSLTCSQSLVEELAENPILVDGVSIPVRKLIVERTDTGGRIIDQALSRCNSINTAVAERTCALEVLDVDKTALGQAIAEKNHYRFLEEQGLLNKGIATNCAGENKVCVYENNIAVCKEKPVAVPAMPKDGLVAYWPFDADAMDFAGNNHGSLKNGANIITGKFNGASSFDGIDDYIHVTTEKVYSNPSEMTVAAWLKPNIIPSQKGGVHGNGNDLSLYSGFGGEFEFGVQLNTGAFTFSVHQTKDKGTNYNGEWYRVAGGKYSSGEWHHVAGMYSSSENKIKLYVDGTLTAQKSINSAERLSNPPTYHPFTIGAYCCYPANSKTRIAFWNGAIDEAGVWTRALSDQEIKSLTGKQESLVGAFIADIFGSITGFFTAITGFAEAIEQIADEAPAEINNEDALSEPAYRITSSKTLSWQIISSESQEWISAMLDAEVSVQEAIKQCSDNEQCSEQEGAVDCFRIPSAKSISMIIEETEFSKGESIPVTITNPLANQNPSLAEKLTFTVQKNGQIILEQAATEISVNSGTFRFNLDTTQLTEGTFILSYTLPTEEVIEQAFAILPGIEPELIIIRPAPEQPIELIPELERPEIPTRTEVVIELGKAKVRKGENIIVRIVSESGDATDAPDTVSAQIIHQDVIVKRIELTETGLKTGVFETNLDTSDLEAKEYEVQYIVKKKFRIEPGEFFVQEEIPADNIKEGS